MGIRPTFCMLYGIAQRNLYNFDTSYYSEDKLVLPEFVDDPTPEYQHLLNSLWGTFDNKTSYDQVLLNTDGFFGMVLESTRYNSKLLWGLASLEKKYSVRGNIAIPSISLEQDVSMEALNLRYVTDETHRDGKTRMKQRAVATGKNYEYFWEDVERWDEAAMWLFAKVGVTVLKPADLRLMICWTWN